MSRRRPAGPSEASVGSESARLVLDTLRTFPLGLTPTGEVLVHDTATGEAAEVSARAYEQVEIQLITEAARCSEPGAHRTLHPEDYRFLVLAAMAAEARKALGEADHVDGIWQPLGPEPHGRELHRA